MSGRGEGKSEDDLVARSRAEYIERSAERFDSDFRGLAEKCESPIERVLLAALIVEIKHFDYLDIGTWSGRIVGPRPMRWGDSAQHDNFMAFENRITLCAQVELGPYRADFAILERPFLSENIDKIIAIECDGHDFHERTKEQARHDKRRDRWMAVNGITCLRFTGSEIWADAPHCADEVCNTLTRLMFGYRSDE